ncbi:MAG TPA: FHA domain-containing protein [Actinomycetota bacterium]|nr:FHA domain-containing protein [Actinomycetota bacterium]
MPALVLDILRYVFLALLWIFLARAVRAIYVELRPPVTRSAPPKAQASPARKMKKAPARAFVLEGDGLKGKSFPLGDELIIGRAERCHVMLVDNYVSQVHARVFSKQEGYMAEDLGSTNGTYVNGHKISSPTEVFRGDRVKVGKTVLELRK